MGSLPGAHPGISLRRASSAVTCAPTGVRAASCSSDASEELKVSRSASTARRRRGGGVVDLVTEGCCHLPEADELLASARHGVHAAHGLEEALDEVNPEREPSAGEIAEGPRRHPEHPPVSDSPGGREIAAALVHTWKPPPHWPGLSIVIMCTAASRPERRTRWTCPSSSTHQQSAGSPSLKISWPSTNAYSSPASRSSPELLVGEPVEEEHGAQLADVDHIVSK